MLFWHLGMTAVIVFMALGRRRIDFRVVLLGAVLPDLIDKPVGRLFFEEALQNSRVFAHTLLFSIVLLAFVMLFLRGDAARRWFILPIASMLHLALDGMWGEPVTLFWPLFGWSFPVVPTEGYWLEVLMRPFTDPLIGAQELVGLLALVYLGWGYDLHRPAVFKQFLRDGRLREQKSGAASEPDPSC